MVKINNKELSARRICLHAYNSLAKCQFPSGEFGKLSKDVIRHEDDYRHPSHESYIDSTELKTIKPNCSITMIAVEGISRYLGGVSNQMVNNAVNWFTKSQYILDGWFRRAVHIVDEDPYRGKPQLTLVADIRHTATALLAALKFGGSINFIVKALSNLLNDNCRDRHHKGWKSNPDDVSGVSDFYATIYILASLDYLISSDFLSRYNLDIDETNINQLMHEGLSAICSSQPHKLGYDGSLPQALRANGALLFFLAPLLSRLRAQYLKASIRFISEHSKILKDEASWLNDDFSATVDIAVGLYTARFALDKQEMKLFKKTLNYISRRFHESKSHHPATLGFILCIYSDDFMSKILSPTINEINGNKLISEKRTKILFISSEPTDESRLRLGEELREIQEKLQLAKYRERFKLYQRMSSRATDLSQALLDIQPHILHFSGHGTSNGSLCVENQMGKTQVIQLDALAELFGLFSNQLNCVVLNACYSENQANIIAKHINYVIGINSSIDDKDAIAFSIGFYQSLGAGQTVEKAYKLGCIQMKLHGNSKHIKPVLIKKK